MSVMRHHPLMALWRNRYVLAGAALTLVVLAMICLEVCR